VLTFDYLQDGALPGAENMGRDEALLRMATENSRPVLRTYGWSVPTISLGYFQGVDEIQAHRKQLREMPLVRRSTGGGAILHDLELTWLMVMPLVHP
jgi:lipoate-protein ligase A